MRRPSRRGVLGVAALLGAAGLLLQAHLGHKAEPTEGVTMGGNRVFLNAEARASIGLRTVPVEKGPFEVTVRLIGHVEMQLDRRGYASSRIRGRIDSLLVKVGDRVKAGDLVATVKGPEFEDLQVELFQALSRLSTARDSVKRTSELVLGGVAASSEMLDLDTEAKKQEFRLRAVRHKLLSVGLTSGDLQRVETTRTAVPVMPVRAPLAGLVHHVDVALGQGIQAFEHLVEITDLDKVWIESEGLEDLLMEIRPGAKVYVSDMGSSGAVQEGKVDRVGKVLDDEHRALHVWSELDNPEHRWLPGAFVRVDVVTYSRAEALLLPRAAIVREGPEAFAFVEEGDHFLKKNLVLGRALEDRVEVIEGVQEGDRAVADGSHQLVPLFATSELVLSPEAVRNSGLRIQELVLLPIDEVVSAPAVVVVPTGARSTPSAPVAGRIDVIHVRAGDRVEAGQVLAEVDSLEFDTLQLESMEAEVELSLLRSTVERLRTLTALEISPRRDVVVLEARLREQEALRMGAFRKLRATGLDQAAIEAIHAKGELLRRFPILSPIAGVVLEIHGVPGQQVAEGQAIAEVVNLDIVWVEGRVSQDDMSRVGVGQPVRMRCAAHPEGLFEGKLEARTPTFDRGERVVTVRIVVPNPQGRLLPNMFCRMSISVTAGEERIAVPRGAVIREGEGTYAFVEADGVFRRIPVVLGRADDRSFEVVRGLYPGDQVVVRGAEDLWTAFLGLK